MRVDQEVNVTAGVAGGRGVYDGVKPLNAICAHCNYQFGGVAIQDGAIICPECGRSSQFELQVGKRIARQKRKGLVILGGVGGVVVVFAYLALESASISASLAMTWLLVVIVIVMLRRFAGL